MLKQRKFWPDWKISLLITAVLRLLYSVLAALMSTLLRPNPTLIRSNAFTEHLPIPGTVRYAFLGIWERFDTLWYIHIAHHGYDRPEAVVFFPLYPALIRFLSPLAGDIGSALVVSTIASCFLVLAFLRLARTEISDSALLRSLALFCLWPASFILFAGYTEALAIALACWAILFAREEKWPWAATCAFAAGLTRAMGILVIVPLAILAWKSRRSSRLLILAIPFGTIAYFTWLDATGRPSVTAAYHLWSTSVTAPWITLSRASLYLWHTPDALVGLNFGVLILFTFAAVLAQRRPEDRAFSAAVILQILLRGIVPPLAGSIRYVLPIYPAFLTMGDWLATMKRGRFIFVCATLFIFNTVLMWAFLNWSLVL